MTVGALTVGACSLFLPHRPSTLVMYGTGYRIWQVQPGAREKMLLSHLGLSDSVGFYRYKTSGPGNYSIILWQEEWNSSSRLHPVWCKNILAFNLRGHSGKFQISFPTPQFPMLWVWNSNPWQGGAIGPLKIPNPQPPLGPDTVRQLQRHGVEDFGMRPPVGHSRIAGLFSYRFGKCTVPMMTPVRNPNKYPCLHGLIPALDREKYRVNEKEIVTYIRIIRGTMREAGEPVVELRNGKIVFIKLVDKTPNTQPSARK